MLGAVSSIQSGLNTFSLLFLKYSATSEEGEEC